MTPKKAIKYHLTKQGTEELQKELKHLVETKRREIAKRLAQAREYGDLTENAEYDAVREEQAFIEGRIAEIEEILKNAVVSDKPSGSKQTVDIGSTVQVHLEGKKQEFTIVSAPEADPLKGKISHESPFAQALIGKKVGEVVKVEAPGGIVEYKILKIT